MNISNSKTAVYLLADIGASFIKMALLDVQTWQITKVKQVAFPGFLINGSFREVCPQAVLKIFTSLLDEFIALDFHYLGIITSTQMHGFILCDQNSEALSNYISWQDTRGGTVDKYLTTEDIKRSGNELRAGTAINNLFWLKEQQLLVPGTSPLTIADFLILKLCSTKPKIHKTNAAGFGAFSLETMSWDREIINKLGLESLQWPDLYDSDQIAGYLSWKSHKIPCYVSIGDQQAALLGVGLEEDSLSINIGTGSQITALTDKLEYGDYQLRPFVDERLLKTFTHIPAGRALNNLLKFISELNTEKNIDEIWSYINESIEKLPATDFEALEVNLAFFPSVLGQDGYIKNINESNLTIANLFRAAYQSMAKNYHDLSLKLRPEKNWQKIILSGGLVQKSKHLEKLLQEAFPGIEIQMTSDTVETLEGLKQLVKTSIYPNQQLLGNLS